MLTSLTLRNFQAHTKLEVELDPHVTVFIGPSDQGKSSVLRALRWLAINQPGGNAFVRHGKKSCRVVLGVDGQEVSRVRGKTNTYALGDKIYTALGLGGVPQEVQDLLAVGPVNFQTQHEPSFWMFCSPGEVSRELNQIVNLGLIDYTLANVASELRRIRSVVSVTEDRLKQAKEKEETLSWVPVAHKELQVVVSLEQASQESRSRALLAGRLVQDGKRATQTAREAQEAAQAGKKAVSLGTGVKEAKEKLFRLKILVVDLKEAIQEARVEVPWEDLRYVEARKLDATEAIRESDHVKSLVTRLREAEEELCRQRKSATEAANDLTSRVGKVCPLCGGRMSSQL